MFLAGLTAASKSAADHHDSTAAGQRYVYLVIMYSIHVELAVSPVNTGHLVGSVS